MGSDSQSWHLDLNHEQWVALPVGSWRPAARYKHAATVFDDKLYVMGGSRNGRYLSDLQVFDLKTLLWSSIKLNMEATDVSKDGAKPKIFPAISGRSMIKWNVRLLLLAGLTKESGDRVVVRFIDLQSYDCGVVETFGDIPAARSGQSVTQFGSKLIMFGGEDRHRQLLNDVHVLDLETMIWSAVETTQTPPSPRFDHTAALNAERYLFIFGGCSHSVFYCDLHVLDLETMEWSRHQLEGDLVAPRAGHAGVAVEGNWYIVGGGDNKSGALETLVINMSAFVVSVVTSVKGRDPLASEGISISYTSLGRENFLFTFGGYNGKYYNEVFALRIKPRDSIQAKILQSPAAAASVTAAYDLANPDLLNFSVKDDLNKIITVDTSQQDFSAEINSIKEEKTALELSIAEITAENSAIETKIGETNGNYAELSKELHSVQGQLIQERSRCANLEAHIAELQKVLESLPLLEEEVQALRENTALERDMERAAVQKQRSGVWKWVAG